MIKFHKQDKETRSGNSYRVCWVEVNLWIRKLGIGFYTKHKVKDFFYFDRFNYFSNTTSLRIGRLMFELKKATK